MAVSTSADLYRCAIELQGQTKFDFYNSLVVASALEAGCSEPLTEDLQHGQRIGSLRIVDPFRR